jgi:molybdopterin biosynthesis enzyme
MRVVATSGEDGRWQVKPVVAQGSHQLWATAGADALALVADGAGVAAGEHVEVLLLDRPC